MQGKLGKEEKRKKKNSWRAPRDTKTPNLFLSPRRPSGGRRGPSERSKRVEKEKKRRPPKFPFICQHIVEEVRRRNGGERRKRRAPPPLKN